MKFELVNPSDTIFLEAGDVRVAKVAAVLVGGGLYGLKDESGETVLGILRFGGVDDFLEEFGGQEGFNGFVRERKQEIADCLRTFQIANGERTSMNDICSAAYKRAAYLDTRPEGPL